MRDDSDYYFIGEYLVWHWSQNQQDKHDLQVSDGQITVKLQQNEVPRNTLYWGHTVIHLALAIGFEISGLAIKSYRV